MGLIIHSVFLTACYCWQILFVPKILSHFSFLIKVCSPHSPFHSAKQSINIFVRVPSFSCSFRSISLSADRQHTANSKPHLLPVGLFIIPILSVRVSALSVSLLRDDRNEQVEAYFFVFFNISPSSQLASSSERCSHLIRCWPTHSWEAKWWISFWVLCMQCHPITSLAARMGSNYWSNSEDATKIWSGLLHKTESCTVYVSCYFILRAIV